MTNVNRQLNQHITHRTNKLERRAEAFVSSVTFSHISLTWRKTITVEEILKTSSFNQVHCQGQVKVIRLVYVQPIEEQIATCSQPSASSQFSICIKHSQKNPVLPKFQIIYMRTMILRLNLDMPLLYLYIRCGRLLRTRVT